MYDRYEIPEIRVIKNKIPIIYLDTNALIELSRYEKGCCKNEHICEIGKLYATLSTLMLKNRIICVLGNQMEEMGTSEKREDARNFIFQFTNAEFMPPHLIWKKQQDFGYRAFIGNLAQIEFNISHIIIKSITVRDFSIDMHMTLIYPPELIEQLRQDKQKLATALNSAKNSGGIAPNYDAQLERELKAELQVFQYNLEHGNDSPEAYKQMQQALMDVYRRVEIDIANSSNEEIIRAVDLHNHFLLSQYHHKLPYIWIRSVLFAHIMQRQKKIIPSDNLDITWAAAYLPFVDYAVTDTAFCDLLNQSGLAAEYGTKVYCFKTLNKLLEEL